MLIILKTGAKLRKKLKSAENMNNLIKNTLNLLPKINFPTKWGLI